MSWPSHSFIDETITVKTIVGKWPNFAGVSDTKRPGLPYSHDSLGTREYAVGMLLCHTHWQPHPDLVGYKSFSGHIQYIHVIRERHSMLQGIS